MYTLSKLIICAVMLRGRHRGLPVALDRAVLLPSEFLPARPRAQAARLHARGSAKDGDAEGEGETEREKEGADVPGPLQPRDEAALAARMRLRTRTISLQVVEERRDVGVGAGLTDNIV